MNVLSSNETAHSWQPDVRAFAVHLLLSEVGADAAALVGTRVAGYALAFSIVPTTDWIEPDSLRDAAAVVVQVDPGSPASVKRFEQLALAVDVPLIAAAYDPPLALVRSLVRAGAHDVVPLPLSVDDLEAALAPMRAQSVQRQKSADTRRAKLVVAIKSVGGCGATALLSQLALRFAQQEAEHGRETCLIDLDLQFGDIAFQLGLQPRLSMADLLEAGGRLDGALLRSTATRHATGLNVIGAPADMIPLEGLSSDQMIEIVDLATREFGTVFVDLPANWTNWSLSLVARADVVLLVTELTIAGINGAKRQLNLLRSQELDTLDVKLIVNRFDKGMARAIRPADVREALGMDIAYTVSNDFVLVRSAIERGVPIDEIKRKSALSKDLAALDAGIAAALRLER
jgi:pilus assembly protein CpaE